MAPLRKQSARNDGLPVSYLDNVTEEQVRKIDELVHEEFENGDWVTVERKKQKVIVRGANGRARELVLLRVAGQTAYVCSDTRYSEAVDNPDMWVGFPIRDVSLTSGEPLAAN